MIYGILVCAFILMLSAAIAQSLQNCNNDKTATRYEYKERYKWWKKPRR